VARVGDVLITAEQIEARLRAQGQSRRQFENVKGLRELVEDQVRFELLAKAALDRGLARDPDVIDAARKVMVRKLLSRDLDPSVFEDAVGEDALRAYYERHRDNYLQPEKRRFGHIQMAPTEEGRAAAQSLIDRMSGRSNEGELFTAAAARFSLDITTKNRGGDQPFQTHDDVSDEFGLSFANVVFASEPGRLINSPVPSTRGWHVVRVVARREALTRDFSEVKEQIREKLLQGQRSKQFQKYLDDIRQTYAVAIFDDRLQTLLSGWMGKLP
jgi:parvulin-like peptidyl-prolyl isomerase